MHFAALVFPGTYFSSLAPLLDAFHLTQVRRQMTVGGDERRVPDLRLSLVSTDGADIEIGPHGRLRIDRALASTDRFDFVWLPAFSAQSEAALRQRLASNAVVISWLAKVAPDTLIGASGAAAIFPMAARLADGLDVPVAAPLVPLIRALFPRFRHGADTAIADHRSLLLSRGIGQDVQALTTAFARLLSPETGRWLRSVFGSETGWDDGIIEEEARDPLVAKARLILEQRFTTGLSIADLAVELCVSHAVLIRRFRKVLGMTPSRYVQHLRLNAAQRMLRNSDRSIDSIAASVGFSDARLFRQMFSSATGISATEWRQTQRTRLHPGPSSLQGNPDILGAQEFTNPVDPA